MKVADEYRNRFKSIPSLFNYSKMKNSLFIFLYSFILLLGCKSVTTTGLQLDGLYRSKEESQFLEIKKDSLFLKHDPTNDHMAIYDCCNTITFGTWEFVKDRQLLMVTSPEDMNPYHPLPLRVTEKASQNDNSKLKIIISNSIEQYQNSKNIKDRFISYDLGINGSPQDFVIAASTTRFDDNTLTVDLPDDAKIYELEITIKLTDNFYGRSVGQNYLFTETYSPKNPNANVFEIDIPTLNFQRFTHRRLNEDYILIVNSRHLRWDGIDYLKE